MRSVKTDRLSIIGEICKSVGARRSDTKASSFSKVELLHLLSYIQIQNRTQHEMAERIDELHRMLVERDQAFRELEAKVLRK